MAIELLLAALYRALGGKGRSDVRGPGQGPRDDVGAKGTISRSGTGIGGMGAMTRDYARAHGQTLAARPVPTTVSPSVMKQPSQPTVTGKRLFSRN